MKKLVAHSLSIVVILASPSALALDNIVRPHQGVRASGMGGVRITTGLYEDNLFGNPARVTNNPRSRVSIVDLQVESTFASMGALPTVLAGMSDPVSALSAYAGTNFHSRLESNGFAIYMPAVNGRKWAFSVALLPLSTQTDIDIRRSYQVSTNGLADVGPILTFGYKLLKDDALSIGATVYPFRYRLGMNPSYGILDYFQGTGPNLTSSGGEGSMFDFDIGATYDLPVKLGEWSITTAVSMNNGMGGGYDNFAIRPLGLANLPVSQPRAFGFGGAIKRPTLWKFTDAVFALEFTDIGAGGAGSFFRLIHMGGEVRYGVLGLRAGFNQGYWALGVGVDTRFFIFDVATYGEEMSLNTGGFEDRRIAFRIGAPIQW